MIKKVILLVISRNFFSSSRAKWGLEMKQIESRQKALSPTRLMPLILFITAILALAMSGVAVAKKCDNPPCGGGGGDSSPYYHVTVAWPDVVGGGEYWTASNNGSVNYAPFNPDFIPGEDGTTGALDLDFFQDYFDNVLGVGKGELCFPNTSGTSTVLLYSAGVNYKKSTGALARFWFEGYTHTLPQVKVRYLLSFFKGSLDDPVPPASSNTMRWGELVELSEWKMRPENNGAEIQANSCVREKGKFVDGTWDGAVTISVLPVLPPSSQ